MELYRQSEIKLLVGVGGGVLSDGFLCFWPVVSVVGDWCLRFWCVHCLRTKRRVERAVEFVPAQPEYEAGFTDCRVSC